jgi:hypothetical protein
LLWQYANLKKAILSDVEIYADGHLHSGAAQGHQPWCVEVEIDLIGYEASAKHYK